MELTRKFGYFCDAHDFKIAMRMTCDDNVPGQIRSLGISNNF